MSRNDIPANRQHTTSLISGAIRDRRRAIGLSQEKLAERIECHRNYVGTVERGEQNVTFDLVMRFSKALETSLGTIIISAKL
ncbi:MAG: helix-turn-helix transcriptional regulator [bacterium]|jgi:transcriptional regulator with XRE-family HTH domain